MGTFQVAGLSFLYQGYDALAFLDNIWYPPIEGWFVVYTHGHGILSRFYRVWVFQLVQVLPWGWTVFPLAADLPTGSGFSLVRFAVSCNCILVWKIDCFVVSSMVYKGFQENILVAIWITLRIDCFSNHICIQFCLISVGKFHDVLARVKDRVVIDTTDGITVDVAFTGYNSTFCHYPTTGYLYFCIDKVVPCLGCYHFCVFKF